MSSPLIICVIKNVFVFFIKEKETQKLYKDLQLAEKICTKHYMEFHRCRTERKQLDNRLQHIRQRRREMKRKEAQRR